MAVEDLLGGRVEVKMMGLNAERSLGLFMLSVIIFASSCQVDPGAKQLPAVAGSVVDAESSAPIAGAEVFATYHYCNVFAEGGPPPRVSRWTTTDRNGRFAFPSEMLYSADVVLFALDGPTINVFHPWYGEQWSGIASDECEIATEANNLAVKIHPMRKSELPGQYWISECSATCESSSTLTDIGCKRFREVACDGVVPRLASEDPPLFGPERKAVEDLSAFLSVTAAARFSDAVKAGDYRFLAIYGFTVDAPGANRRKWPIEDKTLRVPGASDASYSPEYRELVKTAYAYAHEYNAMMVQHIDKALPSNAAQHL